MWFADHPLQKLVLERVLGLVGICEIVLYWHIMQQGVIGGIRWFDRQRAGTGACPYKVGLVAEIGMRGLVCGEEIAASLRSFVPCGHIARRTGALRAGTGAYNRDGMGAPCRHIAGG